MKNHKHKANIALVIVTVGFFLSYPLPHTFWSGLIISACWAGMIGGFADWFAVTALFRRPLGIPYRTAIIPRNRDKIAHLIIDMVEKELLTRDNVQRTFERYQASALLLRYLVDYGGKEKLKDILYKFSGQLSSEINTGDMGRMTTILLRRHLAEVKLAPLLADVLEWSVKNGYDERIVTFMLDEIILILRHKEVPGFIAKFVVQTKTLYERGMNRRRLFDQLLQLLLEMPPLRIGHILQQKALTLLEKLQAPDHTLRIRCRNWICQTIEDLEEDAALQKKVEEWKMRELVRGVKGENHLANLLEFARQSARESGIQEKWRLYVFNQVESAVTRFEQSEAQQSMVNNWVKNQASGWVEDHHNEIGAMIKEKLALFSDEALAAFVESKAGNDLQMIRINGSLVGSILGMVLFIISRWL